MDGEPGRLGRTVVNPGTAGEREIGGKASVDLRYGDVVSFQLAGAGGYGDPAERDPALIDEDRRLGLVTEW
jgi:N-methylhydantoinase B